MNIQFSSLEQLTGKGQQPEIVAANHDVTNLKFASDPTDASINDSTGFHIYADLRLTLELTAATEQEMANLFLRALEDLAQIVTAVSQRTRDLFIFEIQGERIHLFLNAATLNEKAILSMLDVCTAVSKAVYATIKPKVEEYWQGFSMAADHGRAIVISTGWGPEDSLVSLGRPANRPAKRLSRSPQVQSGHVSLPLELRDESHGRKWEDINVIDRPLPDVKTASILDESITELMAAANAAPESPEVELMANFAEVVNTDGATPDAPYQFQALVFRADLDGFTKQVDEAFNLGNDAILKLVDEFLQIMKLPDAWENKVGHYLVRLPWAGDCYTALMIPKEHETYDSTRATLPSISALRWLDPQGEINKERDDQLAHLWNKHEWSVGVAAGEESNGILLVANIRSGIRSFKVAAGWGALYSTRAQNAKGLRNHETALHDEDRCALNESFKKAYSSWEEGPSSFQKATAKELKMAQDTYISTQRENIIAPPAPNIRLPDAKPFYENVD